MDRQIDGQIDVHGKENEVITQTTVEEESRFLTGSKFITAGMRNQGRIEFDHDGNIDPQFFLLAVQR